MTIADRSNIGVVGAGGRLGTIVLRTLAEEGHRVVGLASRPGRNWPVGSQFRPFGSSDDPAVLRRASAGLDAVIAAAPLAPAMCEALLDEGCHVVDVGIDAARIRALQGLGDRAKAEGRCLVTMAGLAPGLSGMLGREALTTAGEGSRVTVRLVQSAQGVAGLRGTRDMLDLLTDPAGAARTGSNRSTGLMVRPFPTPETAIWPADPNIGYVTGFDSAALNIGVAGLAGLRGLAPVAYHSVRDRIAKAKARAPAPADETVVLEAVVFDAAGQSSAGRRLRLLSDYGATAAVACIAARMCLCAELPPGAAPLGRLVPLQSVLAAPEMRTMIVAD